MKAKFPHRILVVDDDTTLLTVSRGILETEGYEVITAQDGFEGLLALQGAPPSVIISDLRMPNMSGFEFLSIVRRRFPHIPVVAISGEFNGVGPNGVIADWFFGKGAYQPGQLFRKIADLIKASPMRPHSDAPDQAPIWIPKNQEGYFVVTCTDCLRSFSVPSSPSTTELREAMCPSCGVTVGFLTDRE